MDGQFGDAPNRYSDAKGRRTYADSSPTTKPSGKRSAILRSLDAQAGGCRRPRPGAFAAITLAPNREPSTTIVAPSEPPPGTSPNTGA
jgi:hypothetical protein